MNEKPKSTGAFIDDFDDAWRETTDPTQHGFGGGIYRQIRTDWIADGFPTPIGQYIQNALFDLEEDKPEKDVPVYRFLILTRWEDPKTKKTSVDYAFRDTIKEAKQYENSFTRDSVSVGRHAAFSTILKVEVIQFIKGPKKEPKTFVNVCNQSKDEK